MVAEVKICRKCGNEKSTDEFVKASNCKDGFSHTCKSCRKAYREAYLQESRELTKATGQKYYLAHREEKLVEHRQYYQENRGHVAELNRLWYQNNWEKARKRSDLWKKNNKSKLVEYEHRRRVREGSSSFTAQEWDALKAKFNHACLGCGRAEPDIKLSPDHVVPLAKGGTNDIGNIQPLCCSRKGNCQSKKGVKILDFRGGFNVQR